jgi:hypothetical protein
MAVKFSLDQLQIASPCPASWEEMQGDNRARFCTLCDKHVYNFAAMTAEEGLALVKEKEGNLCGRLYRRRDGTVLTADCPVGWAAHLRRLRRRCVYTAIAGLLLVLGFFGLSRLRSSPDSGQASTQVFETLEEWLDDLRVWAGLPPKRITPVAGGICAPPVPTVGKIAIKE